MKLLVFYIALLFSLVSFGQTALTVQEISEVAWTQALTAVDVANTNSIANPNGDIFIIFNQVTGAAGSAVITVSASGSSVTLPGYGDLTKSALAVTVTAGQTKIAGPFQTRGWNNSSGQIILTTTGVASASASVKALRFKSNLVK